MSQRPAMAGGLDRLPPYDEPAEQGVLGCCLLGGGESVRMALERFAVDGGRVREVFYDLRHQTIFEVLVHLFQEGKAIDLILVQSELTSRKQLDQVGGVFYLSALMDGVPSAANLEYYLGIVWEKFIGRVGVAVMTRAVGTIYERNGISEGGLARVERELESWRELAQRAGGMAPQDLKRPIEWDEKVWNRWFSKTMVEPGLQLPISFPLKIREHELTLFTGEDGSGKSIFLGQVAIVLMKQGWKGFMASLEVPGDMSLWMLERQLMGEGPHLMQTPDNLKKRAKASAFLNEWMWMYDFVGITDWRLLLDVMRFAREKHGVNFFIVDSIMRIGISPEDLATQDLAAAEFSAFAVKTGAHVFLVQHLNKSKEGGLKGKITGSKRWTDSANNIVEMRRNRDKGEKIAKLEADLKVKAIDVDEFRSGMQKLRGQGDGQFLLAKQKLPGSQQNGSKWLWFDPGSLQFRDNPEDGTMDYLI